MKNVKALSVLFCMWLSISPPAVTFAQTKIIDRKIEYFLKRMTLEEKIGQLTQYSGDRQATGPVTFRGDHKELIKAEKSGRCSMF